LVTWFSDRDPVTAPWARPFRTQVTGAQDQPHQTIAGAGHFQQEDKGEEIAQLIVRFIPETGKRPVDAKARLLRRAAVGPERRRRIDR
jgi:hypothetical protein